MTEIIRTDAEKQVRREFLKGAFLANSELAGMIPDKCSECDEARLRAFALAGQVAKSEISLDDARANFTHDIDECEGTVERPGVYDARPDCWRKRQLGRIGYLRGSSPFTD